MSPFMFLFSSWRSTTQQPLVIRANCSCDLSCQRSALRRGLFDWTQHHHEKRLSRQILEISLICLFLLNLSQQRKKPSPLCCLADSVDESRFDLWPVSTCWLQRAVSLRSIRRSVLTTEVDPLRTTNHLMPFSFWSELSILVWVCLLSKGQNLKGNSVFLSVNTRPTKTQKTTMNLRAVFVSKADLLSLCHKAPLQVTNCSKTHYWFTLDYLQHTLFVQTKSRTRRITLRFFLFVKMCWCWNWDVWS